MFTVDLYDDRDGLLRPKHELPDVGCQARACKSWKPRGYLAAPQSANL